MGRAAGLDRETNVRSGEVVASWTCGPRIANVRMLPPITMKRLLLVPNGENRRVSRRRQHDFRMGTRNLGQDLSGTAGLARALFPMMQRAEADAQQVSELGL